MTAFSGAARIRVTVLRGGILNLGICLTSDQNGGTCKVKP